MKHPWILALLWLAPGEDDAARRAYEEGRYEEARAAFAAVEESAGDDASAHASYNRALAAWRAGRWREAEVAAARAAERDPADFERRRDFLLGNLAFERARLAAAQADQVESEPFAYDAAILEARSAFGHWRRAAIAREDAAGATARRNAERALHELVALETRKAAARARATKKIGAPEARVVFVPGESGEQQAGEENESETAEGDAAGAGEATPESPRSSAGPRALDASELERLWSLLATKEDEKRSGRERERERRSSSVEKDW